MKASDATVLFPYLASTTFDGFIEIVANDHVNYLALQNGAVARAFLSSPAIGTVIERVAKVFSREGRVGDLRVTSLGAAAAASHAGAARAGSSVPRSRLRACRPRGGAWTGGRSSSRRACPSDARAEASGARRVLRSRGGAAADPVADTRELTSGVAAWIREVLWTAKGADDAPPEDLFRELTYERRHIFQSAGLFDQMPWKVV